MGVGYQGNLELGGGGHFLGNQLHDRFRFLYRAFHNQLIVDLEHQSGGKSSINCSFLLFN